MYDRLCLEKEYVHRGRLLRYPPYLASSCASRLRYKHVLSDGDHTPAAPLPIEAASLLRADQRLLVGPLC